MPCCYSPETVTPDHPARVRRQRSRLEALFDAFKQTRLAFVMTIYFLSIVAFSI
jgi:hypothetical protein